MIIHFGYQLKSHSIYVNTTKNNIKKGGRGGAGGPGSRPLLLLLLTLLLFPFLPLPPAPAAPAPAAAQCLHLCSFTLVLPFVWATPFVLTTLVCACCHSFVLSSLFVCWSQFVPAHLSPLGCTGWPLCLSLLVFSFAGPCSMLTPHPLLLPMPLLLLQLSSLRPPLGLGIHMYAHSLSFPPFIHTTRSRQSWSFMLCSRSFTLVCTCHLPLLAFIVHPCFHLFAHTSMLSGQ